jgi:predicted ABC-type ATPase
VRADQPRVAEGLADSKSLPERLGDRDELRQRLERLPPGHPSSPLEADGTPRSPEPGLACREPSDTGEIREPDWRPLTDTEHAEHVKEVRARLERARADGLATEARYVTDPDGETWAPERRVVHNTIIAHLYEATGDVPCERRSILAGGLPGAGKTTVLEQHAGIDRTRFLTINPDEIKSEMAKRGMVPEVVGLTPMEASDLVHEESSHIAKQLALRAMPEGKNIIWDITMSSRDSVERRIDTMRTAGYQTIEGIFVDIPVDVGIHRSDARHREGHDSYRAGYGQGGRFVPAEVIAAQANPDYGSRNLRTFEQIKPHLDAWLQYDNSVDGRHPVLVDSDGRERDEDKQ